MFEETVRRREGLKTARGPKRIPHKEHELTPPGSRHGKPDWKRSMQKRFLSVIGCPCDFPPDKRDNNGYCNLRLFEVFTLFLLQIYFKYISKGIRTPFGLRCTPAKPD